MRDLLLLMTSFGPGFRPHPHDVKKCLTFANRLVGVVIDRFGKEVPILPVDENRFETKVLVSVSPQFYGWVTGIGSGIRIAGPDVVVQDYRKYMYEIMDQYDSVVPDCND